MYSKLIWVMTGAAVKWIEAAMASMTSTSIMTGMDVFNAKFEARFPMSTAPPIWVAQSPETITRGVQGTAMVGERAKTNAFPTSLGVPFLSSVKAAAVQAALEKIAPVTVIKEEAEQPKPPT